MNVKKQTPAARIQSLAEDIRREAAHWLCICDYGCNDPFWADGCNMNLTRNHIINDKQIIAEICAETGAKYPDEYYIPTPPEVDNSYMASLKQKARVDRLRQYGKITTKKCPAYNLEQMSLL